MIRLGVDAWNLPGDHRGIGRYLRSILNVWWRDARDRVEVTLIVPEWHTWTVGARYRREVAERPYPSFRDADTRRAGLDALWFPFNGCSWTNFTLPATATLHDGSNFVVPDYAPETQRIFRAAAARCRALDHRFAFRSNGAGARARGSRPNASFRSRWASIPRARPRRSSSMWIAPSVRSLRRRSGTPQGIRHAALRDGARCARTS